MRRAGAFLLFLVLLGGLVLVARCRLAEQAALAILHRYGFREITLHISGLGLHGLHIDRFSASLSGGSPLKAIRLERLNCSWRLAGLRQGRMEKLAIGSLVLDLERKKPSRTGPGPLFPDRRQMALLRDPGRFLPLAELRIKRLELEHPAIPEPLRHLSVDISKHATGRMEANLAFPAPDIRPLRLSMNYSRPGEATFLVDRHARLAGGVLHLQPDRLGGSLAIEAAPLHDLLTALGKDPVPMGGGLEAEFVLSSRPPTAVSGTAHLLGKGIVLADLCSAALEASLAFNAETRSGALRFALDRTSWCELRSPELPGRFQVERLFIRPVLEVEHAPGSSLLRIHPAFRLTTGHVVHPTLDLAGLDLKPARSLEIDLLKPALPASSWHLEPLDGRAGKLAFRTSAIQADLAPLAFRAPIQADLALRTATLDVTRGSIKTSLQDCAAQLSLTGPRLQVGFAASPAAVSGRLQGEVRYERTRDELQIVMRTEPPIRFSPETGTLADLLPLGRDGFDILGGTLHLEGRLVRHGSSAPRLSAGVRLREAEGKARGIRFTGLSLDQQLQLLPEIRSPAPGRIRIARLETGITVEDLEAALLLRPSSAGPRPRILVPEVGMTMLGGTVKGTGLELDLNGPHSQGTITVQDIDLAEIIRLHRTQSLQLTGRIAGSLPYVLDQDGLRIRHARLHNQGQGRLQYRPPAGPGKKHSALTGYALKAVEDFRYNLLQASADYSPDGDLELVIHLEGKSPGLETDRPVHLNITTSQNLLSLLRSLRFSQGLTEELDKRIQKHYR